MGRGNLVGINNGTRPNFDASLVQYVSRSLLVCNAYRKTVRTLGFSLFGLLCLVHFVGCRDASPMVALDMRKVAKA